MKLHLPPEIIAQYRGALRTAGKREIGGVLMGEHTGPDTFRVERITVQFKGGTFAFFVRLVEEIVSPMREYFTHRRNDYRRYNYIGEWHSHHSFALRPSGHDDATMLELVADRDLGAHFVALLLVRLGLNESLESSVTVYRPGKHPYTGTVVLESSQ